MAASSPPATDWTWAAWALTGGSWPAAGRADDAQGSSRFGGALGLVLINTPWAESQLRSLWPLAAKRILADGAANRLHRTCADLVPDVLVGDFDSAERGVLEAYGAAGVDVRDLSHDQDTTDLEKALAAAVETGCTKVVILGQFAGVDGRIDHTFGIANTLHLCHDLEAVVMADDCYMALLRPGEHRLLAPSAATRPHCGLVPLGAPCARISTTGLEWNMTDARMEFGGLVSVCNRLDPAAEGRVWVQTDSPVLWMCTLPNEHWAQHGASGPASGNLEVPQLHNPGVIVPPFAQECLRAAGGAWELFHEHSFVEQVTSGTLPSKCFEHYTQQEPMFSAAYADAAALLSMLCDDRGDKAFFLRSARLCLETVDQFYGQSSAVQDETTSPAPARASRTAATAGFHDFMLTAAKRASHPVEVAAALAPTVWLYIEGGHRVLGALGGQVPEGHKYGAWLRLYTDPSWLGYCNEFLERLQRLSAAASPSQRERAALLFAQCVRHEVAFWQQAWDAGH